MSNARVNEAEARARAAEAEVERLRARQNYWPEMNRLEQEVERLRAGWDHMTGALAQAERVAEVARGDAIQLDREVQRLRAANRTNIDIHAEPDRLRAEREEMIALIRQNDVTMADLDDENRRLQHDLEVAENDLMFSHEASASYREEVAGLRRQLKVAHAASIRRGKEVERLRAQLGSTREALGETEQEELEYRSWCHNPAHVTHRGPYH